MPNPKSHQLFARTRDIGKGTVNEPHFLCDRRFLSFHFQKVDTLADDQRYGDYFTFFALRIFVWGITRYAGGSKTFDIELPVEKELITKFFNEGFDLARSIELFNDILSMDDFVNLFLNLKKEYSRKEQGPYQLAIANTATLLEEYEPLRRIGAAYMQIKRAGELSLRICNSIDVQRLMNCLQQATFDITSYNMGLSIVHTLAVETREADSIAEPISDFFAPKIDSEMEVEVNDLIRGMDELIKSVGKHNLGEFLTALNKQLRMHRNKTINVSQLLTGLVSEYQINPPLELTKDGLGRVCVPAPLLASQYTPQEEDTYQRVTPLSMFSSSGESIRQSEFRSKCYLL